MAKQKLGTAARTVLQFGAVEAPVALYKTSRERKDAESWDTAGPSGGTLRYENKAVEAPAPREEEPTDPLVVAERIDDILLEPAERESLGEETPLAPLIQSAGEFRPGEFRRVLVEEGTDVEVLPDQVRRGIRLDEGSFVDLTDHLSAIEESTRLDRMQIIGFIDVARIPRHRIKGSYYVGADDPASPRALRILYTAMQETRKIGVVKWTKRTRQSLGVIAPDGRSHAIVVDELEWDANWIDPTPRVLAHMEADLTVQEVEVACELVRAMSDSVAMLEDMVDDAVEERTALRAYVKEHGAAPPAPETAEVRPTKGRDVDFTALLRASVPEPSGG